MTTDELGEKCLVELVRYVSSYQGKILVGITYQDLARRIGFFNKNNDPHCRLGASLGKMGHLLERVDLGWNEEIPHLQALVINKKTRIPDDGINEFWKGYENLPRAEKENKARTEWQLIADFGSRWTAVLDHLGLVEAPVVPVVPAMPARGFGCGGESPAHKALKEFVKSNPHLVGVDALAKSFTEYALPSLDTLDVLFKTRACWTAVEVKSALSDGVPGDYERGLYQIVKYSAMLQAMRRDPKYSVPEEIRVVLVLEHALPPALAVLKTRLQITVIERVKPAPKQPAA